MYFCAFKQTAEFSKWPPISSCIHAFLNRQASFKMTILQAFLNTPKQAGDIFQNEHSFRMHSCTFNRPASFQNHHPFTKHSCTLRQTSFQKDHSFIMHSCTFKQTDEFSKWLSFQHVLMHFYTDRRVFKINILSSYIHALFIRQARFQKYNPSLIYSRTFKQTGFYF